MFFLQGLAAGNLPWVKMVQEEILLQLEATLYSLVQAYDVIYPQSVKPKSTIGPWELNER